MNRPAAPATAEGTRSGADRGRACVACLRRSWLLGNLGAALEYRCRDRRRLLELLALSDDHLLAALAGRRREELQARYAAFEPAAAACGDGPRGLCRHDPAYPHTLADRAAPRMLNIAGGLERFACMAAGPVVAIVGGRRASDYGIEMAGSLARGLAASGVAVVGGLRSGVAVAAHAGAMRVGGSSIAVLGSGLAVPAPASRRALLERILRGGCALSEHPGPTRTRYWGEVAGERIIAALAAVTIVVEASVDERDLAGARIAQGLGRPLAAMPGRLTSPLSGGTHELLREGATLVRGTEDVLELISGPCAAVQDDCGRDPAGAIEPRLRRVLEQVGAGADTPDRLTSERGDAGEVLLALTQLELLGLLRRADGGRYVPCQPLPGDPCGSRRAGVNSSI